MYEVRINVGHSNFSTEIRAIPMIKNLDSVQRRYQAVVKLGSENARAKIDATGG